MTRHYPKFIKSLLEGQVVPATDPLSLILVTDQFAFNPDDRLLSDVSHTQGSVVPLGSTGVESDGRNVWLVTQSVAVDMPTDPLGDEITGVLLLCSHSGAYHLMSLIDRTGDGVPVRHPSDGSTLTVTFNNGFIYGLGGT